MDLNEYALQCHQDNMKWWLHPNYTYKMQRNKGELLMLIVSEVAECMEAVRKDTWDDKLPQLKGEVVELADALIRIFDYCAAHNLDIQGAYEAKRAYNATRKDHTHEERMKVGGKKF